MAHIWHTDDRDRWQAVRLPKAPVALATQRGRLLRAVGSVPVAGACLRPRLTSAHAADAWVLMFNADCPIWVNGLQVPPGFCVLRDRDELRLGSGDVTVRLFFSDEVLPSVTSFPGSAQPAFCPRCRLPLKQGDAAVRCPNGSCGIWHHQTAEFPCWTYAEGCAVCRQSTDLEAGFRWSPEGL